jgi:hypothetical protein
MEIPETVPSSIDQAIEAACDRARGSFNIDVEPKQLRALKPQVIAVFKNWPGEAHPRFVNLFVELWAIAQISRLANKEPGLKDEQVRAFLGQCADYFNCFIHR